jgi:hypothetical protein
MDLDKKIEIARLVCCIINDIKSISSNIDIDFRIYNSKSKLVELCGKKYNISKPFAHITVSDKREFIIDLNRNCIRKLSNGWVYVRDSGWFEWYYNDVL